MAGCLTAQINAGPVIPDRTVSHTCHQSADQPKPIMGPTDINKPNPSINQQSNESIIALKKCSLILSQNIPICCNVGQRGQSPSWGYCPDCCAGLRKLPHLPMKHKGCQSLPPSRPHVIVSSQLQPVAVNPLAQHKIQLHDAVATVQSS